MARSEDDIQPDLNKAPPHVQGELLKQNVKTTFGKKGWRKFFFIVRKDKLQYFRKKEDLDTKEPVAFVRMAQVTEITEAVFTGVPKKHHLNCGFSVVSYHPQTQEEQTFNLLAETPEDMRYWVHGLRYIKAYWSKIEVRNTVMSADQERMLLDRILKEEEDERDDDLYGDYGGEGQSPEEITSRQVSVYFSNGSKVKVTISMAETTSDLLEMSEVKNQLSSSAAYVVRVDENGRDVILEDHEHPALSYSKLSTLYAVEQSHRLLVVFIGGLKDFKCIFTSSHATASEVIEHKNITHQLDMTGITNRGLFLKSTDGEQPFGLTESPCEVLFEEGFNGELKRLSVGKLVVKNKALGGGRSTARVTRRIHRSISRPMKRTVSEEGRKLEEISEEEDAQARALANLFDKKIGGVKAELESTTEINIDGEIYVLPPDATSNKDKRSSSGSVASDLAAGDEKGGEQGDDRGFEETTVIGSRSPSGREASMANLPRPRARAAHVTERPVTPPTGSPTTSPPRSRSRSKSPGRRLPDLPEKKEPDSIPRSSPSLTKRPDKESVKGSPGGLRRRGATRGGSLRTSTLSTKEPRRLSEPVKLGLTEEGVADQKVSMAPRSASPLTMKRGPTIVLSNEKGCVATELRTERTTLTSPHPRSPSGRNTKFFENLNNGDSRSSAFGRPQSPVDNVSVSLPAFPAVERRADSTTSLPVISDFRTSTKTSADDEARLENLLSRTFQQEQEERSAHVTKQVDTLSAKVRAVTEGGKEGKNTAGGSPEVSPSHKIAPMLIDFKVLQARQETPPTTSAEEKEPKTAAIKVTSPSLLKVILLQSSEAGEKADSQLDSINLSGVCLQNKRGVWLIQEGYNYHDPLPYDNSDHTETFPLPGGIRAVYNHTHKRWHVYPPPITSSTPSGEGNMSVVDSIEHTTDEVDSRETSGENSLFLTKKMVVTEIGTSFHHIMEQFEKTRDQTEKKKIGSDMTNPLIGHIVRGELCTAIAHLLLDGLKPYRFEGLVQDDIWKVTVAFSNEAQTNPSSLLVCPAFDKLIFQPINSLKAMMKDNNIKFRTFVCLAMSKGVLTAFLEALPKQSNTLKKFYYSNAFLRLAADYQPYQALYQQILVSLEPMVHLPFDLGIDFESRQAAEIVREGNQEGSVVSGSPLSDTSSLSEQSSSSTPVRPIVVVKTHAATGQRSTAGNVKSVVWDTSPLHVSAKGQVTREETDSDGHLSTITALRQLQEKHEHQESTNRTLFPESPPTQRQARPTSQRQNTTKKQAPWWKKLSDSLMELNMGGAITGPPKKLQPRPQPQPPPNTNERRVKALYNNIGDDADELTFNKDDILVVKEQINEEWLICTTGNRSGIVPVSYVQPLR